LHEGRVFISVNGLSFSDIIFIDDLNDPFSGVFSYKIKIDEDYTTPFFLQDTSVAVLAT
jgi:hypothetical protein